MRCHAFLFAAAFIASFGFAQEPDDVPRYSESAKAGQQRFAQACSFCHGTDARGASAPDLIRSALVSHDQNGNLIGEVLRNGRPEKGMPAFSYSDEQIRQLADFLHTEAKLAATVARRAASDYPLEKLLLGDAKAGKAYFNGEGKCNTCHSPTGDLAGLARKYKPIDLQGRIAFPSGAKPVVTVTDRSGAMFTGEQVHLDEFIVSLRDKSGWTRTWYRKNIKLEIRDPLAAHEQLLTRYTDRDLHNLFAYLVTFE